MPGKYFFVEFLELRLSNTDVLINCEKIMLATVRWTLRQIVCMRIKYY